MDSLIRIAAIAAALALAAPASAQQRGTSSTRIGVGIAIIPIETGFDILPPIEIYVPIGIAPQLRLEPSLGLRTSDESGPGAVDRRDLTLGIGVFFVNNLAQAVDMYAGGRLKLNFANQETAAGDDSDTDLILAAALGGEYFFVPKFSLGLEAQLGLYDLGDISGDVSGVFTQGLAFLRVYF